MWNKIKYGAIGLGLAASSAFAQVAPATLTNDPDAVNDLAVGVVNNATSLFDQIVPIILAVVGLGILLTFAKMVKKR